MANLRHLQNDADFATELSNAGTRLVVADYFATWCGPCRAIAPAFTDFSTRYPKAVFLKIDVDQCQETAQHEGVSAMPTFIFYRNKTKLDTMRGADPALLEEKIKKWYTEEEGEEGDSVVRGHMDLLSLINKSASECLNESDEHTLEHCLTAKGGYLESDCDEQLIINIGFLQSVKLHSLKLHCSQEPPASCLHLRDSPGERLLPPVTDNGPKNIKLFINQPHTLDFDSADSMEPVQMLELTPEDLQEGAVIPLKYVKLQNVISLTLFIKDNQVGADTTRIDYLALIGSPTSSTNMAEFKRVAGKKGESH